MKEYALVFSGGGAKGAYQIGVWRALKEYGLDSAVTYVSGTSVGSLNGVLFAQRDYEAAEAVWSSISNQDILSPKTLCLTPFCQLTKEQDQELLTHMKSELPAPLCRIMQIPCFKKGIYHILIPIFLHHRNKNIPLTMAKKASALFLLIMKDLLVDHDMKLALETAVQLLFQILQEGLFSQEGLKRIIEENLDVTSLKKNGIHTFLHAYDVSKLQEKTFELKGEYLNLCGDIMLASAAIPGIFENVIIQGDRYIDGGIPIVGDNEPIDTVFHKAEEIICVVMSPEYELKAPYHTKQVHVIQPSVSLGGMFDGTLNFQSDYTRRLIKMGYQDGLQQLKPLAADAWKHPEFSIRYGK